MNSPTSEGLPAVAPALRQLAEPAPDAAYDAWDRPENSSGSTVLYFLQLALRKWSWIFIPLGVVLAVAAVLTVWLLYEPEYLATGWVRMRTDIASVSIASDRGWGKGATSLLQPDLILTPFVVGPVLSRPDIANLPEILEEPSPQDWLPSQIRVVADGLDVMRVQYQSTDVLAAQKIVDAVIEEYERVHVTDSRRRISRQLAEIKNQLRSTQAMINESNSKLASLLRTATAESLQQTSSEMPPDATNEAVRELRLQLQRRLAEANFRRELAREKLNAFLGQNLGQLPSISTDEVREELAQHFDPVAFRELLLVEGANQANPAETEAQLDVLVNQERERQSEILRERLELRAAYQQVADQAPKSTPEQVRELIDNHPNIVELENQLRQKRNDLQEYKSRLHSSVAHPGVKKLMSEISELQGRRDPLHTELTEQMIAEYDRQARQSVLDRFDTLVAEINDARVEQTVISNRLSRLPQIRRSPASPDAPPDDNLLRSFVDSSKMETIRKELAAKLVVLEELVRQELVLTMQSGLRDSQLATIPSTVSSRPVNTTPYRNMFLAGLVGLVLPCGLGMLWEWHVKRISAAEQFTTALGIPVLGEIARMPTAPRAMFVGSGKSARRDSTIYEQSTLVLSDNISHSRHLRHVKVMAVSSAVKGEGKSHLAVKLAVNLAQVLKGKVLLVDGDIRFRTAEHLLGVAPRVGLSELLREESTIDEAIDSERDDGLHVLTAGGANEHSYHQLRNGVLTGIFSQLRERYKYIIIDSPPILSAGESLSLGKVADGTLICALRDVSRVPLLRKAISRLEGVGVRPIGAILAGVPASHYENSYYAYSDSVRETVNDPPLSSDRG